MGMPAMNPYMTGYAGSGMMNPPMMGMPNPQMGMMPLNPYVGAPSAGNFATAMPGLMGPGAGLGMPAGSMGQYGTNMGGFTSGPTQFGANPFGGQPINRGPGIESFQKDGFKVLGKEPVKPKNEEGSKEFAELFSLADQKIKDRNHEKPRFDLSYNPDMPPSKSQPSSQPPIQVQKTQQPIQPVPPS